MTNESSFSQSIVSAYARRTVDGVASAGLRSEAASLAGYIYSAPWDQESAKGFVRGSGLFGAIGAASGRRWRTKSVDFIRDPHVLTAQRVALQLAAWPDAHPLVGVLSRLAQSGSDTSRSLLLSVCDRLVSDRKLPWAATTLACAARPEFAGQLAVERLAHVVAELPKRDVDRATDWAIAVAPRLNDTAYLMADLSLFGAATMSRLMAMIPELNAEGYEAIARKLIAETSIPASRAQGTEKSVELGGELWRRGYWAQSLDLLDATLGVAPWDRATWSRMWRDVAEARRESPSIVAAAASLLAPPKVDASLREALGDLGSAASQRIIGEPQTLAPAEIAVVERGDSSIDDIEEEAAGKRPAGRQAIVAVTRVKDAALTYRVRTHIGIPQAAETGAHFKEPDWGDREFVDLRITLEGMNAEVSPAWHELRLPRRGDSDSVEFRVVAQAEGPLVLYLRIYTAADFVLLEEYSLKFTALSEWEAA